MGVPVRVDSDDLETLLFGTAAVKQIEQVVQGLDRDRSVMLSKPKFAAAHDRVAHVWQQSQAMQQPPPPTQDQIARVRALFAGAGIKPVRVDMAENRDLSICGLVVFGERFGGYKIDWAPPEGSEFTIDGEIFHVCKLTPRGRMAVLRKM